MRSPMMISYLVAGAGIGEDPGVDQALPCAACGGPVGGGEVVWFSDLWAMVELVLKFVT